MFCKLISPTSHFRSNDRSASTITGHGNCTLWAYCSTSAFDVPELTAMNTIGSSSYLLAVSMTDGHLPLHLPQVSS